MNIHDRLKTNKLMNKHLSKTNQSRSEVLNYGRIDLDYYRKAGG